MLESEVDHYQVIDTDTHVIEPYDLWTSRLAVPSGATRCPTSSGTRTTRRTPGTSVTERIGAAASAAQAGWHEYPPEHPPRLADVDPATWDATPRLARMDEYGIWAQVLYPNVAGFGAGKLLDARRQRADARLRAGLQRLPGRVRVGRPQALHPDHGAAVLGHGAVPSRRSSARHRARPQGRHHDRRADLLGLPQARATRTGTGCGRCARRLGLSGQLPHRLRRHVDLRPRLRGRRRPHANYAGFGVQFGLANVKVIANLITGGVCHRFPGPQVRVGGERRRLDPVRPASTWTGSG